MQLSEGRRRSIRARALVLGAVLLVAVSATACGPPPRVHTGPVPVQLFSWEMGRNLPVYTGIVDIYCKMYDSTGQVDEARYRQVVLTGSAFLITSRNGA